MSQYWLRIMWAVLVSGFVLAMLAMAGVALIHVILVAFSQLVWLTVMLVGYVRITPLTEDVVREHSPRVNVPVSRVNTYHLALGRGYERSLKQYLAFERRLSARLLQMRTQVSKAEQIARQTRQLAVNASLSAARCGEAGKGFAIVSAELIALNQQAEQDLAAVGVMLEHLRLRMLTPRWVADVNELNLRQWSAITTWANDTAGLRDLLVLSLEELERVQQRYRTGSCLDVRGVQLAEAVSRLMEEIHHILHEQLVGLHSLLYHLNLVQLSHPDQIRQIVENSIRLSTIEESGKILNEFVT